jgi:hypothetical protein
MERKITNLKSGIFGNLAASALAGANGRLKSSRPF